MASTIEFEHQQVISLHHTGEAHILALAPDNSIYIEEYYDDADITQHHIDAHGSILHSIDDNDSTQVPNRFTLPPNCTLPVHPTDHLLNLKAVRQRGLRHTDRVSEWVQPLSIAEKMPLIKVLGLSMPAMMMLGIAESRVLAQSMVSSDVTLVCRRVGLAYALSATQYSADGLPFDYDTMTLHLLHHYDAQSDTVPPLHEAMTHFPILKHPLDCLYHKGQLLVTEAGINETPAKLHWFTTLHTT